MRSVLVTLFLLVSFVHLAAQDADEILEEIRDRYDEIDYLQVDYDQINKFKLSGIENRVSGKIFIASDDRFRMENEQQTIVTDGKKVWSYSPINKQLIIDYVRQNSNTILPRELLFNYGERYYANLLNEYEKEGEKWYLIKLTPKPEFRSAILSMKIWVKQKDWLVHKIEYLDLNENTTTFEVKKMTMPKEIAHSVFSFSAPEGTKIIDMTNR